METRSTEEMLELILSTAKEDPRIHAVTISGSRVDMSNPKDIFMDFDIVYIVDDYIPFIGDLNWAKRFGDPMIIQLPNHMDFDDLLNLGYETFLMQFKDGTRIDLTLENLEHYLSSDRTEPEVILWDPKHLLPELPDPDGSCYYVKEPSEKDYYDCCNEYWWLHPYIAKELWRGNMLYVKFIDRLIRNMFERMLGWYLADKNDYKINIGKHGKFMKKYLNDAEWKLLLESYSDGDIEHCWTAILKMDELFRIAAYYIRDRYNYTYLQSEDEAVSEYLKHIHKLPKDAANIYND